MTFSAALPILISKTENKTLANVISIFAGALLIAALAQIAIPLPWTAVPITGQTFGVSLMALTWGWKRSSLVMGVYLIGGSLGLPFFASIGALGATSGYLIGMLASSVVLGFLADSGWTNSFLKAFLATYLGSAIVLGTGLFVLSFFVPSEALLTAGLWPFLPGDLFKNFLAANLATKIKTSVA